MRPTLHLIGNIPGILEHIRGRFGDEPVYRQFNRDLLVFLADPEQGPIFTRTALREYGLEFESAYSAALDHTRFLFQSGNISILHDGLLGHVECEGFWASHLVLMDWFWENNPLLAIEGELVIGLPTRSELLFTDTAKLPIVPLLMQSVGQRYEEGPHRVSGRLFVRRKGAFEPYVLGSQANRPIKKWWTFWKK